MKLLRPSRIRLRCGAILNKAVLAFVFVGLTLVRSPTFIIPPTGPANPVTVYVVEQGYHSSLVLPDRDGGLIQYPYGDWRYFALNQQDFSNAMGFTLGSLLSSAITGSVIFFATLVSSVLVVGMHWLFAALAKQLRKSFALKPRVANRCGLFLEGSALPYS